jgi:hypothetical protein
MTERERDFRDAWQKGPTGPAPTTESVGDPEADNLRSGAEEGAAMGGLVGTAVAGPFGLVAGAVAGAVVGGTGEAADPHLDAGYERRAVGTGPTDPIYAYDRESRAADDDAHPATDLRDPMRRNP